MDEFLPKQSRVISFLIFAIIILQNPIWCFWSFPGFNLFDFSNLLSYFLVLFLFLYLLKIRRSFKITRLFVISFLCAFFIYVILALFWGFNTSSLFIMLTFLLPFAFRIEEKGMVIDWLTKYLGIILLISCVAWLVHHYLFALPLWGIFDGSAYKGRHYIYGNYFFFLELLETNNGDVIRYIAEGEKRFYSMFDEPGLIGTLSTFVLFANRYNWRNKWVLIISFANLFTFSVAFYLLTFLGWATLRATSFKRFLTILFIVVSIGALVFILFSNSDIIQKMVFERILSLGDDSLSNRTDYMLVKYLSSDSFRYSTEVLLGIGATAFEKQGFMGNSWMFFFLKYGLVGLFSVVGMYLSYLGKFSRDNIILLTLFLLSFLNRPFLFSSWQILLFACMAGYLKSKRTYMCLS